MIDSSPLTGISFWFETLSVPMIHVCLWKSLTARSRLVKKPFVVTCRPTHDQSMFPSASRQCEFPSFQLCSHPSRDMVSHSDSRPTWNTVQRESRKLLQICQVC